MTRSCKNGVASLRPRDATTVALVMKPLPQLRPKPFWPVPFFVSCVQCRARSAEGLTRVAAAHKTQRTHKHKQHEHTPSNMNMTSLGVIAQSLSAAPR